MPEGTGIRNKATIVDLEIFDVKLFVVCVNQMKNILQQLQCDLQIDTNLAQALYESCGSL